MFKFEKKCIEFCEKHVNAFYIVIISALAVFIRYGFLDLRSGDYFTFLRPWFEYFRDNGGIFALKDYPGNYNAPYMTLFAIFSYIPLSTLYLVKYISILFDFFLAFVSSRLVREITKGKNEFLELLTYGIVLFLPNVIMNSSAWAQCDSIYTSFVFLSLLLLLKKKYKSSFIALGVAFAFKLQFVFILPLYVILYFREKEFSIFHFFLLPITNIVLCLPAILMGKPFLDCISVYWNQVNEYTDYLVMNFNNLYQLLPGDATYMNLFGIIFTFTICFFVLFYCIQKKIVFNTEKKVFLGLWFLVVTTFFLPGMHERYLFMGEVLSVVLLIVYKKPIALAIYINLVAIITYSTFLFLSTMEHLWILSFVYVIILIYFTIQTFQVLNQKVPQERSLGKNQ